MWFDDTNPDETSGHESDKSYVIPPPHAIIKPLPQNINLDDVNWTMV